jgi:hypothetical protein
LPASCAVCTEVSLASAINARAALLILTVYDDVGVLVLEPVADEAVVPERDDGGVDAEPELDVTDGLTACAAL